MTNSDLKSGLAAQEGSESNMEYIKRHIESFAKEDNRVRVYSNGKNKGAGAARNHGIDISSGKYLAFMDPDDYVEDDFYERLYRKATEGDGHDTAKGCRKEVSVHGVETGSDPSKLNKRIKSRLNEKNLFILFFLMNIQQHCSDTVCSTMEMQDMEMQKKRRMFSFCS